MRQFVGPVATDTAPSASPHLTRKDYVDAGDAGTEKTATKNAANGYCGLDGNGLVSTARFPPVFSTPSAPAYAATMTLNAASSNNPQITATGNLTLNAPSNPSNGQPMVIEIFASGATRTVTLAAAIALTTGLATTLSIPSGKVGIIGLRYSALAGAWLCLAQTVQS